MATEVTNISAQSSRSDSAMKPPILTQDSQQARVHSIAAPVLHEAGKQAGEPLRTNQSTLPPAINLLLLF